MNIWKIASRWSEKGTRESTILNLFWKHNVAFFYPYSEDAHYHIEHSSQNEDGKHDLIAIADGYTVVAVAKPLSEVKKLSELDVRFSRSDHKQVGDTPLDEIVGVKVKMFEIPKEDQPWYPVQTRFCHVKSEDILTKIIEQWETLSADKRDSEFNIEASTLRIKTLLERSPSVESYIVPIYQRPYSWGDAEIERFLGDIFSSIKRDEELFIGTMQLSEKYLLSPLNDTYFQEVIDGQQRLTTCFLILKALKLLAPEHPRTHSIQKNAWLETCVSNGVEQEKLDAIDDLSSHIIGSLDDKLQLNRYVENCLLIYDKLRTAVEYPEDNESSESPNKLSYKDIEDFLLNKLVFVVIETKAGLSKTLQIFNTINTAGLDLNGSDLFKVRTYEYLTDQLHLPKDCFEEISRIYELIERENLERKKQITTISEVLWLYQKYIIANNNLPNVLNRQATETFYNRLFDALLEVKTWDNYQGIKRGQGRYICLETLNAFVNFRYEHEKRYEDDKETRAAYKIIEWSRYSEYWSIPLVIQCHFREDDSWIQHERLILKSLAKLFIVYSLIYGKKVNEIHTFMADMTKQAFSGINAQDFINEINKRYAQDDKRKQFEDAINAPLAFSPVPKNLICRLLEYLKSPEDIDNTFRGGYDIEHIQSYNDQNKSERERIREEWTVDGIDYLNGIGNLMLLEFDFNRSIGNKKFSDKREIYRKSKCSIARHISNVKSDIWGLKDAQNRHKECVVSLMNYVFE